MKPPIDGWIPERELVKRWNLTRSQVRARRPAVQSGEVQLNAGEVHWEKNAAQRIGAALGLSTPLPDTDHCAEVLKVAYSVGKIHVRALRSNGELVMVRVRDASKFVPRLPTGDPMTFSAQKNAAGGYWSLVGREPRFVGRW